MTRETPTHIMLNFYMKHVDSTVCCKILNEAGWYSFTEYELEQRVNDVFECSITDGFLDNIRPDIDESRYLVTEISLHHLTKSFRKHLLKNYLQDYTLIEYETLFADTNSLYVVVEYYDIYSKEQKYDVEQEDAVEYRKEVQTNTLHNYFDYASDSEKHDNTVDDSLVVQGQGIGYDQSQSVWSTVDHISQSDEHIVPKKLHGFKYKLKSKNAKTLTLFRPDRKVVDYRQDSKWIKFDDNFVYPIEWSVDNDDKIVGVFSKKQKGWVFPRNNRKALSNLGATFYTN